MWAFTRTAVLYVAVIIAMRLMGKRTIGEMHPTELVVSIMISDLATIPLQGKNASLLDGLIPIFTLLVAELFFAFLILKFSWVRRVLEGRSISVVKNGRLLKDEMSKLRVTIDDVEEQIRIKGYTSLKDIDEVVIETNGQVSVIGKEENEKIPYLIVCDGKMRRKNMERAKVTEKDIEGEMKKLGIGTIDEVFYMSGLNGQIVHIQSISR